MRREL